MSSYSDKQARLLEEKLSSAFKHTTPDFMPHVLKRENILHQDKIFKLLEKTQREQAEIERHKDMMIAEETNRVIARRSRHAQPAMAGYVSQVLGHHYSVDDEARLHVEAQIVREQNKLAQQTRQKIYETLKIGEQYATLKIEQSLIEEDKKRMMEELRKQMEESETARQQLSMLFNTHRSEMIKTAQEYGEEHPEKTVSDAFKIVRNGIDAQEEERLSAIFTKHGHDIQGHAKEAAEDLIEKHDQSQSEQHDMFHEEGYEQDLEQSQEHDNGQEQ